VVVYWRCRISHVREGSTDVLGRRIFSLFSCFQSSSSLVGRTVKCNQDAPSCERETFCAQTRHRSPSRVTRIVGTQSGWSSQRGGDFGAGRRREYS